MNLKSNVLAFATFQCSPRGRLEHPPRPPQVANTVDHTISLASAPTAAPSVRPAGSAREQSLVQLGVSDADHSPRLPASFQESEEASEKLTKELTKNLETLDTYGDKLAREEKDLGLFFNQQVTALSLAGCQPNFAIIMILLGPRLRM
jgi:hypothetical protein